MAVNSWSIIAHSSSALAINAARIYTIRPRASRVPSSNLVTRDCWCARPVASLTSRCAIPRGRPITSGWPLGICAGFGAFSQWSHRGAMMKRAGITSPLTEPRCHDFPIRVRPGSKRRSIFGSRLRSSDRLSGKRSTLRHIILRRCYIRRKRVRGREGTRTKMDTRKSEIKRPRDGPVMVNRAINYTLA